MSHLPNTDVVSKRCSKCGETKEISAFGRSSHTKDGYLHHCKVCRKVYTKSWEERKGAEWRAANPDKVRGYHLKSRYGISLDDREAAAEAQSGVCAICLEAKPLYVDHCHDSLAVRGLLCRECNFAIGALRDDPEVIMRAARYVQEGGFRAASA